MLARKRERESDEKETKRDRRLGRRSRDRERTSGAASVRRGARETVMEGRSAFWQARRVSTCRQRAHSALPASVRASVHGRQSGRGCQCLRSRGHRGVSGSSGRGAVARGEEKRGTVRALAREREREREGREEERSERVGLSAAWTRERVARRAAPRRYRTESRRRRRRRRRRREAAPGEATRLAIRSIRQKPCSSGTQAGDGGNVPLLVVTSRNSSPPPE